MIINGVNNKQNSTSNFGSIQFSKNVANKKLGALTKELKDTFHIVAINSQDLNVVRSKINYGVAAFVPNKEHSITVVGKDKVEEAFLHKKITASFDPDAKLIPDAPEQENLGPAINLLG